MDVPKNIKPSYMVFPIFLNSNLKHKKKRFINTIEKNGLQTRPVISGSFVNQPATKLYALNEKKKNLREQIQSNSWVLLLDFIQKR